MPDLAADSDSQSEKRDCGPAITRKRRKVAIRVAMAIS